MCVLRNNTKPVSHSKDILLICDFFSSSRELYVIGVKKCDFFNIKYFAETHETCFGNIVRQKTTTKVKQLLKFLFVVNVDFKIYIFEKVNTCQKSQNMRKLKLMLVLY